MPLSERIASRGECRQARAFRASLGRHSRTQTSASRGPKLDIPRAAPRGLVLERPSLHLRLALLLLLMIAQLLSLAMVIVQLRMLLRASEIIANILLRGA